MANLKTRVLGKANLSNRSNFNAFDLSHRNCFTNSTGNICPVAVMDVLPTEKVSLNIGWFSRAQTLITNSYGRFVENVQAFYVPYSAIYRNYSQNALTSALSNAKGANECRVSDGLGVKQPLNDGYLPSLDLSEVWEYLWFLALYEHAYASYATLSKQIGTELPSIPILSRSYMTRSMSVALLLEQLGYGSFSVFTDPKYRREVALPVIMQPGFEADRAYFSYLALSTNFDFDNPAEIKTWWKKQRNAYSVFASPMRLLAYHKVYNDYYRNDTWQPYESETCNCDYLFKTPYKSMDIPWSRTVSTTSSTWDEKIDAIIDALSYVPDTDAAVKVLHMFTEFFSDNTEQKRFFTDYNLFDPRCCNLPLDAVNGVLPEPQYGNESEVEINTFKLDPTVDTEFDHTLKYQGTETPPNVSQGKLVVESSTGTKRSAALTFSVRDMRIAESLQKFKEISISNDNYFVQQLKAHFGEAPIYDPFKTYFIGGKSTIMQVDTQVNQNLAGDENATLGGIASAQGSFNANYKADDYGCIIVLHSLYPIIDYPNDGIDESLLCVTADSLPVPEFDNNGFEGVRNIYVRGLDPKNYAGTVDEDSRPLGVYGYGARYWSWKTAKDVVNGDFKYSISDKVMGFNPLVSSYGILENSLLATPLLTDRIFANTHHSSVSDDQFYTNMQVGVSILRPFSVHGLPYAN